MQPRTGLFKPLRGWAGPVRPGAVVEIDPAPLTLVGRPTARLLIALAARYWRVRTDHLAGPSRDMLVVAARHHAMWLMRTHTELSLAAIGSLLGDRDHTTVIHGIAQHQDRMAGLLAAPFIWTDPNIRKARRLVNAGHTIDEVWREMGITRNELRRCPGYPELRRQCRQRAYNRMIAAKGQRKAEVTA